jgi:hypothetical protein
LFLGIPGLYGFFPFMSHLRTDLGVRCHGMSRVVTGNPRTKGVLQWSTHNCKEIIYVKNYNLEAWVLQKQNFLHSDGERGGHFLSTYFLTVKKKEGGHLFFSIFFSKISIKKSLVNNT